MSKTKIKICDHIGLSESTYDTMKKFKESSIYNINVAHTDKSIFPTEDEIIEIDQLKGKEIWHYKMLEDFFSACELFQINFVQKIILILI